MVRPEGVFDPAPVCWDGGQGLIALALLVAGSGRCVLIIPAARARSGQSQWLQAQGNVLFCENCWCLLEKGEMAQAQEERRRNQD